MAKLSVLVAALAANETNKALVDELNAALGSHGDVEIVEIGTKLGSVDAAAKALTEAQSQVSALTEQIKGFEPKAARLEKLDGERRVTLLDAALAKAAKDAGIQDAALKTALSLIDKSKLDVDLDKGEVKGASKEIFEGLKGDHSILFTPPAQTIPPAPANSGQNADVKKFTQTHVQTHGVDPVAVLSGKAVIEN